MSGEVKLGEADYTVFWERLLFMSNILCQISWKRPFDAYSLFMSNILEKAFWCLQPFQSFSLLENAKKIRQKSYLAIMNKSGTYIDYHV